jgi:hypothetical protein
LEKEAEQYNNPQNYVKYAKMERQINAMKKKLESEQGNTLQEDNAFMKLLPNNLYLKIGVEFAFYIVNIIIAIMYRNEYITFESKADNIVLNYFKFDENIRIPFYLVIVALHTTINRIENLINLTYNLIK